MSGPCFPGEVKRSDFERRMTPLRAAGLWRFAKDNFIDKGVPFEQMLTDMSDQLQMPRDWVASALTKNKRLVPVTNEIYKLQETRRGVIRSAKQYVATADAPRALKALNAALSIPRRVLTLGHGAVFPVTHALDLLGSEWASYGRLMKQSWGFMSKADHAKAMDHLRNDEAYAFWRKSGLEIDPDRGPSGILSGGVGNTSWSRRAWDALKVTRLELAKDRFERVPTSEQTPAMAKELASQINHATGVMNSGEWGFGALSKGMFAPQLTASKIAKTLVDPAKTGLTGLKIIFRGDVPFEQRYIAALRTRKAGKAFATMMGLLAVNQGLNIAFGKKERVNFFDYGKSDWLRPKAFGHTMNTRGSMEIVRLLGNLIRISQSVRKELHGKTKTDSVRDAVARYAEYKLDPVIQDVQEAALGEDLFGRPLPWTDTRGTHKKPRYDWTEYALTKGPIYLGGAAREFYDTMRQEGISSSDITGIMRALWRSAIVGGGEFVGGGIQPVPPKER